jgi:hypothetical protein
MNQHSAMSFLQEWYEMLKTGDQRTPDPTEIADLHEALSIRSRELKRIQTAVEDGTELFPILFRPQPLSCTRSTFEALDESSHRQFMIAQAQRAGPWLKELRAYMEKDRDSNGGEYESVVELIERKVHEPEAKNFALQVADELRALDITVIGSQWWTYGTFPDTCTAFWLACPRESPTGNWTTYALIDLSESAGIISSGVNDPGVWIELIGFLISLFERRHFHSGTWMKKG